MKTDKTKIIVEGAFELMESEERDQGFERHEYVAEVLIYTDAARLDPDSRQLHGMIDDVLDRECITVHDPDCGWRYYGKDGASLENIKLAAKSRVAWSERIVTGAIRNASMQLLIHDLVDQGETYHAAESIVRRTFGKQ